MPVPARSPTQNLSTAEREALKERFRQVVAAIGTQAAAAKVAKVSLRQLRNYMAGRAIPSYPATGRLAEATGFSLDWIFTGAGPEKRIAGDEHRSAALTGAVAAFKEDAKRAMGYARMSRVGMLIFERLRVSFPTASADALHRIAGELVALLFTDPRSDTDEELVQTAIDAYSEMRRRRDS